MKRKMYWGVAILILLLICVTGVFLHLNRTPTEPEVFYEVPSAEVMQQVRKSNAVKRPPSGETYGTGHWEGEEWHRTAPPEPDEISVDGEMLTYADLRMKLKVSYGEDRRKVYQHLIEAYPYSELALQGRWSLAGDVWPDKSLLLPRYKEMLKYHPDSPRVLQKLAQLTEVDAPEESIFYATEGLKYVDLYPSDSTYGRWTEPEEFHANLGMAYQRVGDYESALVHLKKTRALIYANPGRRWEKDYADVFGNYIKAIEDGNPIYGPPSEVEPFEVYDESLLDPFNLPPVSDVSEDESPAVDADVWGRPRAMSADPVLDPGRAAAAQRARDLGRAAAAQQAGEAFVQRQQQEFDAFVRWMEQVEHAKSPTDLEDFLMREMAKQLFQATQQRGIDDGIKHLQKIEPEVAKEIARQRAQRPRRTRK